MLTHIHLYPVLVGEDDSLHDGGVAEAEAERLTEQLVDEVDIVARGEEDFTHHDRVLPRPHLIPADTKGKKRITCLFMAQSFGVDFEMSP